MNLTPEAINTANKVVDKLYDKFNPTSIDVEDLRQEAYIAILEYDGPVKPIRVIVEPVCKKMLMQHGYSFPIDCAMQRFEKLPMEEIEETYIAQRITEVKEYPTQCDFYQNIDKEIVRNAVSTLTERQQRVLALRYWGGLYLEEAGKMMNVSRERIRQIEVKALQELRRYNGRYTTLRDVLYDESHRPNKICSESSSGHIFRTSPQKLQEITYNRLSKRILEGISPKVLPAVIEEIDAIRDPFNRKILLRELYNSNQKEVAYAMCLYKINHLGFSGEPANVTTFIPSWYERNIIHVPVHMHEPKPFHMPYHYSNTNIAKVVLKLNDVYSTRFGYMLIYHKDEDILIIKPVIYENGFCDLFQEVREPDIRQIAIRNFSKYTYPGLGRFNLGNIKLHWTQKIILENIVYR